MLSGEFVGSPTLDGESAILTAGDELDSVDVKKMEKLFLSLA